MSDEKSFQYVKIILPLFRAVVKFCSTNRLFMPFFVNSWFKLVIILLYVNRPTLNKMVIIIIIIFMVADYYAVNVGNIATVSFMLAKSANFTSEADMEMNEAFGGI